MDSVSTKCSSPAFVDVLWDTLLRRVSKAAQSLSAESMGTTTIPPKDFLWSDDIKRRFVTVHQ